MCSFWQLFHADPISGLHPFSLCPATPLWSLWEHTSNPHWNSDLIQYLTTVLLPKMSEQVTDLIERLQTAWGRWNRIQLFTTFLFLCHLSPVFPQLITPFFGEQLFRHPHLCLREGCNNSLPSIARINMRFVLQNILSSISAEGWSVSFSRSRAAFSAV